MRRGLVLPFPAHQHLTQDDHAALRRFAAATPDAQIDLVIGRGRREIVIVAYVGRQLWIKRDTTSIHARDGASGELLGQEACIDTLLAVIQRSLLPGGTFAWTEGPEVLHGGQSCLALAGE